MCVCRHTHPSNTVKPRITLCLGVYTARAHAVSGTGDGQIDSVRAAGASVKRKLGPQASVNQGSKPYFSSHVFLCKCLVSIPVSQSILLMTVEERKARPEREPRHPHLANDRVQNSGLLNF